MDLSHQNRDSESLWLRRRFLLLPRKIARFLWPQDARFPCDENSLANGDVLSLTTSRPATEQESPRNPKIPPNIQNMRCPEIPLQIPHGMPQNYENRILGVFFWYFRGVFSISWRGGNSDVGVVFLTYFGICGVFCSVALSWVLKIFSAMKTDKTDSHCGIPCDISPDSRQSQRVVNSLQIANSLRILFLVCRGPLGKMSDFLAMKTRQRTAIFSAI